MKLKIIKNIFLSFLSLFIFGCGQSTSLTPSMKMNHLATQSLNSPLHINEVLSSNVQTNYDPDFKEFSDWIEIYNDSNKSIDLSGYYLSDSQKNIQKWQFPQNTTINANSYLLVWADGKNCARQALHTNFKLSSDGEQITLADPDGKIVDGFSFSETKGDISIGIANGTIGYMTPTPGIKNSIAHTIIKQCTAPHFSHPGGIYETALEITLDAPKNSTIYYTLDGSTPTHKSLRYTHPINIDQTTVIRAIAFQKNRFPSKIVTYTYLIGEKSTLPIVSLTTDDKNLYDDEIGIWKNYNKDWMRAGSIELIKNGREVIEQNIGIRLHGSSSRAFSFKSFTIVAKDKYGKGCINYPLFRDKPSITKVKSFTLRNAGNDWVSTLMRDGFVHTIAKEMGTIDYLSYEPVVVFLNGRYYGIMNLRETPNKEYVEANHNIKNSKIDLLKFHLRAEPKIQNGNANTFHQLLSFVASHDLQNEENYATVISQIDIASLIDYFSLELFINNNDWLTNNNNMRLWRTKNSKWQWILYDTEMSLGLEYSNRPYDILQVSHDRLQDILNSNAPIAQLFQALLENPHFKQQFVTRFNELLDTTFSPQNLQQIVMSISSQIAPEIERHITKWQTPIVSSYQDWEERVHHLSQFVQHRRAFMQSFLLHDLQ